MIILGVILLSIGFVAKVATIWTFGAVVVGAILALVGFAGHAVGAGGTTTAMSYGLWAPALGPAAKVRPG